MLCPLSYWGTGPGGSIAGHMQLFGGTRQATFPAQRVSATTEIAFRATHLRHRT
jgi:hypothetical protein